MNTSAQISRASVERPSLYVVREEVRPQAQASLITPAAAYEFNLGRIPDLRETCLELHRMYSAPGAPRSAVHAIPVLRGIEKPSQAVLERLYSNEKHSHVLVDNAILRVVLIHWPAGKISSIHGHPSGGCMFKVLRGKLTELRYSSGKNPKLLSSQTYQAGGMAYIDDDIAYHAVANPYQESAVSIHVYTRGMSNGTLPKA